MGRRVCGAVGEGARVDGWVGGWVGVHGWVGGCMESPACQNFPVDAFRLLPTTPLYIYTHINKHNM